MSAPRISSPLPPTSWNESHLRTKSPSASGRIISTRQLRQRNMLDVNVTNETVSDSSPAVSETQPSHQDAFDSDRRTSTVSNHSQRRSPSPSQGSKTPLTPDESPPSRLKKQNVRTTQEEDKEPASFTTSPAHRRGNSADDGNHVCICQRDPKIPRPRNAFILYRQHHQANVVAQHPGLSNPEISKIIGEQWQSQTPEVKDKWKSLAEEEKVRHQQQYPTYRYQPKRNGRRVSLSDPPGSAISEKARCPKCAGRSILSLSSPGPTSALFPQTPVTQNSTPVTRTLPVLGSLSLQSSDLGRENGPYSDHDMQPAFYNITDDRDDLGPLSPELKRRRYNVEHPPSVNRSMPPRYPNSAHPVSAVGPGTPFPFTPIQSHPFIPGKTHPYPQGGKNVRRESLPGLRGVVSPPGPMAPPPRPRMGYQQHRASNGHLAHDRSLTLPPLQTNGTDGPGVAMVTPSFPNTVEEHLRIIPFHYKIKTLGQIAPPLPLNKEVPRGPVIAVEGDNVDAVNELAVWLQNEFKKDSDLAVQVVDGPDVSVKGPQRNAMIEYHQLVSDWIAKSEDIATSILMVQKAIASPMDSKMSGTSPAKHPVREKIDENYDDSSKSPKSSGAEAKDGLDISRRSSSNTDDGDTDRVAGGTSKSVSVGVISCPTHATGVKPVVIIPNFSVHASTVFALRIPIAAHDSYAPRDHWQWTATQWRGVVGPDLTIFLRDDSTHGNGNESAGGAGKPAVEMGEEGNLFVVKRGTGREGNAVEASVLRRLGFELSEWIRAFGIQGGA